MNEFNEDTFDLNAWLDEQAALDKATDMHYSLYFDPESQYEPISQPNH